MVGIGPLERAAASGRCRQNVELLGWLPPRRARRRFERAVGFVHVGEEDFGISMVEALAAGTPVVALGTGGACDIVCDGVDGVLLEVASTVSIRAGVEAVAGSEWDAWALAARAGRFSRERFVDEMLMELGSSSVHTDAGAIGPGEAGVGRGRNQGAARGRGRDGMPPTSSPRGPPRSPRRHSRRMRSSCGGPTSGASSTTRTTGC